MSFFFEILHLESDMIFSCLKIYVMSDKYIAQNNRFIR